MHLSRPFGLLLAGASLIVASSAPAKAPPPPAAGPSMHVRCDGNPDNITAGETAARLIALTAVVGLLLPQHEQADPSKRLSGAEGVAACNDVLTRESNPTRRVQLILARGIHRFEAREFEAAIADSKLAETDQPALTATPGFRLSFHLSAMELEALALLGMGRTQEAAAKGMEMGLAAPYDLLNMLRASRFAALSQSFGPREAEFYDALVRIHPSSIGTRAAARELGGDFKGAAEDFETWSDLVRSILDEPDAAGLTHATLARALAGDAATAEARAKAAQDALQAMIASGQESQAGDASEPLELYRIWAMADAGQLSQARLLFSARSWLKTNPAAVARVAERLRSGARPDELTGALAGDPAALKAERLAAKIRAFEEADKDGKLRYSAIRSPLSQGQFNAFSANVWRGGASKYLAKKDEPKLKARLIDVQRNGGGIPAGYAVILHSALAAKAQGKTSFMLMPLQKYIYSTYVRIGNPGEAGVIGPLSYDADRVIADLRPLLPPPAEGK